MDHDDALAYTKALTSYFTGDKNKDVILSNASEDSTACLLYTSTCERNVQLFCENLENYAAGRPMHHLVDRRKGY